MNIEDMVIKAEFELKDKFNEIDDICYKNSKKVLEAFKINKVSEYHFNSSSGYGYNDPGRDIIEKIYSYVMKSEDALVRSQFISGTHALTVTLFGLLRPKDTLLSITGKPYDTLDEVIGIRDNDSSLKSFGINFEQIDLINNDFDYDKIKEAISTKRIKVIEIQRSKGYSLRKSITYEQMEKVIKFIKSIDENIIILIDNCYCELVGLKEPCEAGADVVVGSLIKNMGGGLAPNGAYVVGKSKYVNLIAERLTSPGQGKEVGPSLGINKQILQGLFMAPNVVKASLKTALLSSKLLEYLNIETEPNSVEERADIVQSIIFKDREKMINYCVKIQNNSPIDSDAAPIPFDMPGYNDKVIMASGSFVSGSSIELSCDGPLRPPYIAYQQGSLTYEYGKLAVIEAVKSII